MKKFLPIILSVLLLLALCACAAPREAADDGKLRVVTTIVPVYDWTKNLLGDNADAISLRLLLDEGVDMHSFQPAVSDLAALRDCELLIYVGGESDEWIDEALEAQGTDAPRALKLIDALGERALTEELVEGMQGEAEDAPDEHIWLSLKNAQILCSAIRDALIEMDGAHARGYEAACAVYEAKLQTLDAAYQAALDAAGQNTLLIADRFPFRYLTEDYGLNYYAAFSGCSADTEASFNTVVFLADKLNELALGSVCVIENSDEKLARTVIDSSGREARILVLDSMQGAGEGDYLTRMTRNLETLKEALR